MLTKHISKCVSVCVCVRQREKGGKREKESSFEVKVNFCILHVTIPFSKIISLPLICTPQEKKSVKLKYRIF